MAEENNTSDNFSSDKLSRRERRKLAREEKKDQKTEVKRRNWKLIALVTVIITGGIYLLINRYSKPLPGVEAKDLGRDHVTDIAGIEYSSNPPSSGPHFTIWAKQGVYDRLISDGHLIHSLEHGYINISYDCTKPMANSRWIMVKEVYAHDEPAKESTDSGELLKHLKFTAKEGESWFTPENPPEIEVELPEAFNSDECKNLVSELTEFTKAAERVIVVPRTGMDTPIALTAWGRILKLNFIDEAKIKEFIRAFHNKGPEKTME